MFRGFPNVMSWRSYSNRVPSGAWWLIMAPGLVLAFVALAILIWPELLAYFVATVMLVIGVALVLWGWTLRQIEQRRGRNMTVR